MSTEKKSRKKKLKSAENPSRQDTLTVVTVRISDDEKERIDRIMSSWNIKRYSDVMRMAVQMLRSVQMQ